MGQVRDVEDYAFEVIDHVKNNLNSHISGINSEKSDSLTLDTVNADAYYYQQMSGKPSYLPNILFALDPSPEVGDGQIPAETVRLTIQITFSGKTLAKAEDRLKLALRYRRAIKDVIKEIAESAPKKSIVSLPDLELTDVETKQNLYVTGVGVEFSIA